jgi:hypothetical protein
MKMELIDYIMCLFVILLFITVASCTPEEDQCAEYSFVDEMLVDDCEVGVCTKVFQTTTTCISYEGE